MTRTTISLLSAVSVLMAGVMVGCGPAEKFTRPRYETIYAGQESWEVEATLGPPYHKFSDTWTYIHHSPWYKAVIGFDANGGVSTMEWYDDKEMGDHPDSLDDGEPIEAGGSVIIESRSTSGTIDD